VNLPININEREKKFLIAGGIAVVMILLFQLFDWYGDTRKEVELVAEARRMKIEKELRKLADKENLEMEAKLAKEQLQRRENMLLKSSKPPIAASELQRTLTQTASALNIDIKLERTLNPVDTGTYLAIPVEIGFTTSTGKLKDMLLRIRNSVVMLTVNEMKIRVNNVRNPKNIYTTLIVTGFIKKESEGEEEKKQVKRAT
jgi:Tfp pilus assembly protein PilN